MNVTTLRLEPGKWYRIEAELRQIYGAPQIINVANIRMYGDDEVGLRATLESDELVFTEKCGPDIKSKLVELATRL